MTDKLPLHAPSDDLTLGVFRRYFGSIPDLHIGTLFSVDMPMPAVITYQERRSGTVSHGVKDDRFLTAPVVAVNTLTAGINADVLGAQLQEACRQAIRTAQQEQWVIPGGGSISVMENSTEPSRVSDWATSTGVVQYAALPNGAVRYEAIYRLIVRPPPRSTTSNPFIPSA